MPGSTRAGGEHPPVGGSVSDTSGRTRTTSAGRDGTAGCRREVVRPRGGDGRHRRATVAWLVMAPYSIRVVGDPVLRSGPPRSPTIDGRLAKLAEDMIATMYEAPGLGLAAPQVGVQKRLFVYDLAATGPRMLVNPAIAESDGEWAYEEGCLSVPGLSWEIVRPKQVHLTGIDLDGNEVVDRGRRARWPGCSSTSSTTSTACCCSSGSTPTPASRRCGRIRDLGIGPSVLADAEPRRGGLVLRLGELPPAPAHPRRLVFLGTPEASVVAAAGLVDAGSRRRARRVPARQAPGPGRRARAVAR